MNLIGQFFGVLALVATVIALQIKHKRKSLIVICLANLLFAINFLLLKAYSGSIICLLAVIQSAIFYMYNKKAKEIPIYLLFIFISLSLIIGFFTYQNIYSIFPLIAGILNMFAMYTKNMKWFRIMNVIISSLWIIYDIVSGAYTALLAQTISLLSVGVAITRYDIIKNQK